MLHLKGDYQVSELKVDKEDWLANKSLSDLCLRDEGLVVLGIQRPDGRYLGAPNGQTCINPQDLLILYGRANNLSELDSRQANRQGDAAHQNAMAKQKQVVSEQNRQEETAQTKST